MELLSLWIGTNFSTYRSYYICVTTIHTRVVSNFTYLPRKAVTIGDMAFCALIFVSFSVTFTTSFMYTPPLPERASWKSQSNAQSNSSTIMYNIKKEICCDGQVYPVPESYTSVSCCGTAQYSLNKQVCCSNISYTIKMSFVCCGNKYHNPRETACCYHPYSGDAFLVLIAPGTEEFVLCCGIRAYDTRTHICCTMEISETGPIRPSSDPFVERVTRFIVYERLYRHSACCKGKVYNAETGACADLQLTSRSLWTRLRPDRLHPVGICGYETYDTILEWCCSSIEDDGHEVYRISSLPCCGSKSYDQETHLCCGDVIHVQNEFGSLLCCGKGGIFDAHYQECCDNSYNVIPSRRLLNRGDMCCGGANTPYYSHRQACCASTIIDVPQSVQGEYRCCLNPFHPEQASLYLKNEEICCGGIKYVLTPLNTHCCGQEAYSPEKFFCCDERLILRQSPFDSCCGPQIYNGQKQVCCGREEWSIMKRNSIQKQCCLGTNDDKANCMCQVETPKVYPRLARTNACCSLDLYDTRTHICCNGTIIDRFLKLCCRITESSTWDSVEYVVNKRSFNSECCGTSSYNPQSQICCNNTVVAWMGLDDLACCGNAVYDRQTEMCCDLTIRDKIIGATSCCGTNVYDPIDSICCEKTKTLMKREDPDYDYNCCYTS